MKNERRDEILKMDDGELFKKIIEFSDLKLGEAASLIYDHPGIPHWLCYQAEEKIKAMGLLLQWGTWLETIMDDGDYGCSSIGDLAHAHPRDRARAILLTIEIEEVER